MTDSSLIISERTIGVDSPAEPGNPGPADKRVVPGLDGLRGVAVLAVMAFHAGLVWARGGLLGVDVFFVLSGYLVTSLLADEHARSGGIALRRFWARRARRLLPGLLLLVAGLCLYAAWAAVDLRPQQLRGDALSSLFYVANWHYILAGQNYFIRFGAPSPLLHTWSLAVEEQFYLVWPLVALFVLNRWGRRGLGWVAGILAIGSASLCTVLYLTRSSIDRLYYGTDTRSQAIMVGAALALLVPPFSDAIRRRGGPRRPSRALAGGGILAAAFLGSCIHSVDGRAAFLYEGGFLAVALATAVVITLVVLRPADLLSRALSWRPLRYIGRISYGLYLYHWPIFLTLDTSTTHTSGYRLLALRFAVTFAAAGLSYRYIERPIRNLTARPHARHHRMTLGAGLAAAVLGLLVGLMVVTAPDSPTATASAFSPPPAPGYISAGGATASHPERALLVGDSLALTLAKGMSVDSRSWAITIHDAAAVGCDLDPQTTVNVMGTVSKAAQGCPQWQADWSRLARQTDPDVVIVLLGRWESIDRLYQGRWTHVGQPDFDAHLRAELSEAIDVLSSGGAKVAFLTLPYIAQTTDQPNGSPWDMNLPSRTDAFNADVRAAVARHPEQASVVDLNRILDPDGHYVSSIDGVRVRAPDDEHLSAAGGEWLRPRLLPQLVALGAAHFSKAGAPVP
jgi:peptidoglycan/LPS O-acetylase OafA/YrhL